jgi:hypothetical protein
VEKYYLLVCVRMRACACVCAFGYPGAWACACLDVHEALLIQQATLMRHVVTSYVAPGLRHLHAKYLLLLSDFNET